MAWTAPVNPVGGTVITVAYAVSNILDPIRWLRILTGNADPPASAYVAVSTSVSATVWSKVTADVLASNAVATHLGYTPANKGGDTFTGPVLVGDISLSGTMSGSGTMNVGNTGAGTISAARFVSGAAGITSTGPISAGASTISTTGQVSGGSYAGGSLTAGSPSFLGVGIGTGGVSLGGPIIGGVGSSLAVTGNVSAGANIAATGQVSGGSYAGGSTAAGSPSVRGLSVGLGGVAVQGIVTVYGGEQVYSPTNPPPTAGGGASVPSGLIAFIATGAVPTGWSFYPAANGRVIVAAGSASVTNPQTFAVGNNYGSDWAHVHNPNTFTVTGAATFGLSDMTQASGDVNGLATAGGVNLNTTGHRHSLNGASAAVSGSATGSTAGAVWVPPAHALNAIRKD